MAESEEQTTLFREFQIANLSSFLPNLLIAPAVWLVFAPINDQIGLLSSIVLTLASIAIRIVTTRTIEVTSDALRIGNALIPRKALGKAVSVATQDQFTERGSNLDSRAFLALKSGLPGLVKIEVTDDEDPTPYLLISTRRASELVELLNA
jgi:Protein of unknown function (DUF3093)